jgi:hypothetical protein
MIFVSYIYGPSQKKKRNVQYILWDHRIFDSTMKDNENHRTIASTPTPNNFGGFLQKVCAGAGYASRYV